MYTLRFQMHEQFSLWLNANTYNVIKDHNSLSANAYYLITGKQLRGVVEMPFVQYASPSTKISFDIASRSPLQMRLRFGCSPLFFPRFSFCFRPKAFRCGTRCVR